MATDEKQPFAVSYSTFPAVACQRKVLELMQSNASAYLQYLTELGSCRTPEAFTQLTQDFIKQRMEAFQQQTSELMSIANKRD